MDVIYLTTLFSVLFAVLFLVFFIRTRTNRDSSAEQDSLLPFRDEPFPIEKRVKNTPHRKQP